MSLALEPPAPAASCIIWLHGLGADSSDFYNIVPEFNLPANHHTRFIFPNAAIRNITINGGAAMRGWYDIVSLDFQAQEDAAGMLQSTTQIWQIIEQQVAAGIATDNIMLAGFSQGAALSLYAGLCYEHKLGGIIALSGYLPLKAQFMQQASAANNNTRVFMAHGVYDPVVSFQFGDLSYKLLDKLGYNVNFRSYPMEHTLCVPEIKDIADFIKEVFAYA
jgi:phospholipase/carboxylesterase